MRPSDIFIDSNDAVVVRLDRDGDDEDADFHVQNKDGIDLFKIDESGDIFADYNGGLDFAVPYALGYINSSAMIVYATNSILDATWTGSAFHVKIDALCSESRRFVVQVTPVVTPYLTKASSSVSCDGTQHLVVTFEDLFGVARKTSFNILVYRMLD